MTPPPDDVLSGCLSAAWTRLREGAADRRSPFHTPTLASLADGMPTLRTVVLRAAESDSWQLRVHTDRRSPKWQALAANPAIALHVYDPVARLQLRAHGHAALHAEDAIADAGWAGSRPMSRACYAQAAAPGAPVPAPPDAPVAADAGNGAARGHFGVIRLVLDTLEWLELAREGHRRAHFRRAPDGMIAAGWLAP